MSPFTYPPEFEELWALWPRKQKKRESFRVWDSASIDLPEHSELIRIVKVMGLAQWQWEESRYWPSLINWLDPDRARWEDEPMWKGDYELLDHHQRRRLLMQHKLLPPAEQAEAEAQAEARARDLERRRLEFRATDHR